MVLQTCGQNANVFDRWCADRAKTIVGKLVHRLTYSEVEKKLLIFLEICDNPTSMGLCTRHGLFFPAGLLYSRTNNPSRKIIMQIKIVLEFTLAFVFFYVFVFEIYTTLHHRVYRVRQDLPTNTEIFGNIFESFFVRTFSNLCEQPFTAINMSPSKVASLTHMVYVTLLAYRMLFFSLEFLGIHDC